MYVRREQRLGDRVLSVRDNVTRRNEMFSEFLLSDSFVPLPNVITSPFMT